MSVSEINLIFTMFPKPLNPLNDCDVNPGGGSTEGGSSSGGSSSGGTDCE